MNIQLRHYMPTDPGYGHLYGQEVYHRLQAEISSLPTAAIWQVSLAGITWADVSFMRRSIVALASFYRGQRGFYVVDGDQDLLDNIDGAAYIANQPIFAWSPEGVCRLLGPTPSAGAGRVLEYALTDQTTYSSNVASDLGLTINAASNALNHLWQRGYLLRQEDIALSGGREYCYSRIRGNEHF